MKLFIDTHDNAKGSFPAGELSEEANLNHHSTRLAAEFTGASLFTAMIQTTARRRSVLVLAGSVYLILAAMVHAAAGDLDTSFAGTGRTRFGFGFGEDFASAVAVQPDGKLVVAGSSGENGVFGGKFSVVRYDTNDLLDPSFGDGGKVITSIPGSYLDQYAQAKAMQIQDDGKIVLAGSVYDGTNTLFALVRYNPDGSLDDSFGTNGITITAIGPDAPANALAIQPDGKILVAGTTSDGTGSGHGEIALVRYTISGEPDPSFGISGKVVSNFGRAEAIGLAVQSSGKILVAGSVSDNFAVVRYTTGGDLDPTFGSSPGNGILSLRWAGSSLATALAIQPGDGQTGEKIVVVGRTEVNSASSHFDLAITRLDSNGFSDFAFGFFGTAIISISPSGTPFGDFPTSVLIEGAGSQAKIIVAGYTNSIGAGDGIFLLRLQGLGVFDPSFDGDGKAFTRFSPEDDDQANAMAFLPDGKLVVVGSTVTGPGNHDFALARYNLSDGSLDTSFDENGKKTQDIAERNSSPRGAAIQPDGKIVVAGSCYTGQNYTFALARLTPNGVLDPSFGSGGKVTLFFGSAPSEASAVVIQPDGKIVAVGDAADHIAVIRLLPNGALDPSFDDDGIVTTPFNTNSDAAVAVTLQADGKIVVAGRSNTGANNDFAVVRYRTNGALDPSFNFSGKVTTAFGTNDDVAAAVGIQGDGKIVVTGYSAVGGRADVAAVRYNTNGTRDASFGISGRVTTAVGDLTVGAGLAIQPDGKILIGGYSYIIDVDGQLASVDVDVIRYNTNGAPDNTFDGDGVATTTIGGHEVGGMIALQPDGKIVVIGVSINDPDYVFAVRYLANGKPDPSYGVGGMAVTDSGGAGFNPAAVAIDAVGRAVVVYTADGLFSVARLRGDSNLKILSIARPANGHTLLTGNGIPGSSHTLQSSTNLTGPFGTVGPITTDSAGRWQYEDAAATNLTKQFYRLAFP